MTEHQNACRPGLPLVASAQPSDLYGQATRLLQRQDMMTDRQEALQMLHQVVMQGETGLDSLQDALATITAADWRHQPDTVLAIYSEAIGLAAYTRQYAERDALLATALNHAPDTFIRASVYELRLRVWQSGEDPLPVLRDGLEALRLLRAPLPDIPRPTQTLFSLMKLRRLLGKHPEWLNGSTRLPEMQAPHSLLLLRLLAQLLPVARQAQPELVPLIISRAMQLSLEQGCAPGTPYVCACYALLLCSMAGRVTEGSRLGQLALRLLQQQPQPVWPVRTRYLASVLLMPWRQPLRETLPVLAQIWQAAIDSRDHLCAAQVSVRITRHCFLLGETLETVQQDLQQRAVLLRTLNQPLYVQHQVLDQQLVENLMAKNDNPLCLDGNACHEAALLYDWQGSAATCVLRFNLHLYKLMLACLFHAPHQAREQAEQALALVNHIPAWPELPLLYFYDALSRLALYPQLSRYEQRLALKALNMTRRRLRRWARYAPMTLLHRYELLEAERQHVFGRWRTAAKHYQQAVALATQSGYVQDEALACELAGRFWLTQDQAQAQHWLQRAVVAWERWGATAKVHDMQQRYATVLDTAVHYKANATLEAVPLLRLLHEVNHDLNLPSLLTRLLSVVMTLLPAQRIVLILLRDQQPCLEAELQVGLSPCLLSSIPLTPDIAAHLLPLSVIRQVLRERSVCQFSVSTHPGLFQQDVYLCQHSVANLLVQPLIMPTALVGLLYLEQKRGDQLFETQAVEQLVLLAPHFAITLHHALVQQQYIQQIEQMQRDIQASIATHKQDQHYSKTLV